MEQGPTKKPWERASEAAAPPSATPKPWERAAGEKPQEAVPFGAAPSANGASAPSGSPSPLRGIRGGAGGAASAGLARPPAQPGATLGVPTDGSDPFGDATFTKEAQAAQAIQSDREAISKFVERERLQARMDDVGRAWEQSTGLGGRQSELMNTMTDLMRQRDQIGVTESDFNRSLKSMAARAAQEAGDSLMEQVEGSDRMEPNAAAVHEKASQIAADLGIEDSDRFKTQMVDLLKQAAIDVHLNESVDKAVADSQEPIIGAWKTAMEEFAMADKAPAHFAEKVTELRSDLHKAMTSETAMASKEYESAVNNLNRSISMKESYYRSEAERLDREYRAGTIDVEAYNSGIENVNASYAKDYEEYQASMGLTKAKYQDSVRPIVSKYNAQFDQRQAAIARSINEELKARQEQFIKENAGALQEQLKVATKDAITKEYQKYYEDVQAAAQAQQGIEAWTYGGVGAMGINFLAATRASFGSWLKGEGITLGSQTLHEWGDRMAEASNMPHQPLKEFGDLLNPIKLAQASGDLVGYMAPGLVASGAAAAATGGAGAPMAVQLVASGAAGWLAESSSMAGMAYERMLNESGSREKAEKAAAKTWETQAALAPAYAFEGLPFLGKAIKAIGPKAVRIGAGAGIEMATESLQEIPQGIFEAKIAAGQDPYDGFFKELDKQLKDGTVKETLLMLSPTLIMGGAGQVNSETARQEMERFIKTAATSTSVAKHLKAHTAQWLSSVVDASGDKVASGVLSMMHMNGTISDAELREYDAQLTDLMQARQEASDMGLTGQRRDAFVALASEAGSWERKANGLDATKSHERATGGQLAMAISTNLRDQAQKVAMGDKSASYVVIKHPNGKKSYMDTRSFENASSDFGFMADFIAVGQGDIGVSIEAVGPGADVLVTKFTENAASIMEAIEARKEAATQAATGNKEAMKATKQLPTLEEAAKEAVEPGGAKALSDRVGSLMETVQQAAQDEETGSEQAVPAEGEVQPQAAGAQEAGQVEQAQEGREEVTDEQIQVEARKKRAADQLDRASKALKGLEKETGKPLKIQTFDTQEEFAKEAEKRGGGTQSSTASGFYDHSDGTIAISLEAVGKGGDRESAAPLHEATHPILDAIAAAAPEQIDQMYQGVKSLAGKIRGVKGVIDFSEEYEGPAKKKEAIVEFVARVADGQIDLNDKTTLQRVREVLTKLASMVGIEVPSGLRSSESVRQFAATVSQAFESGKELNMAEIGATSVESSGELQQSKSRQKGKEILGRKFKFLTPQEQLKATEVEAQKMMRILEKMPSANELAGVALAGAPKRGWYRTAAKSIFSVFGEDSPRFAGLLAALSPQTIVKSNMRNAINAWANWVKAGRPTDRAEIVAILADSVEGNKGEESVMNAWINNSVEALTNADPIGIMLSGPKVDSFMRNLLGNVQEVTNDTWMASYFLFEQTFFAGSRTKLEPGKRFGYLSANILAREAAAKLTKMTGEQWTPAEVQETIWSWSKAIYEASTGGLLPSDILTQNIDDAITAVPDFATMMKSDDVVSSALEKAGYGKQLEELAREDTDQRVREEGERIAAAKETEAVGELVDRSTKSAAKRLDKVKRSSRGEIKSPLRDPQEELGDLGSKSKKKKKDDSELIWSKGREQDGSLGGLPRKFKIAGKEMVASHFAKAEEVAVKYMEKAGLPYRRPNTYQKVDPERAKRIAEEYDRMEHNPDDPEVKAAYQAMADETMAQWEAIKESGLKVEFMQPGPDGKFVDPYAASPRLATEDVRNNNHLWVFPTEGGFGHDGSGTLGTLAPSTKPGQPEHVKRTTDIDAFIEGASQARKSRKFGPVLGDISREQLAKSRLFMSEDGKSGFAITEDGDLINTFSTGKGRFPVLMEAARLNGVKKVDTLDTGIVEMYKAEGFVETDREAFDDRYAPEGWTKDLGRPDHVYLKYEKPPTIRAVDHPLLQDSGEVISGKKAVVNDIFRAVHDYFGHIKEGLGFRAGGEENAWRMHSSMYSPLARRAMTTETRGQNSWVNFGPYGEKNRTAKGDETIYADQKVGLLPQWVVENGAGDPIDVVIPDKLKPGPVSYPERKDLGKIVKKAFEKESYYGIRYPVAAKALLRLDHNDVYWGRGSLAVREAYEGAVKELIDAGEYKVSAETVLELAVRRFDEAEQARRMQDEDEPVAADLDKGTGPAPVKPGGIQMSRGAKRATPGKNLIPRAWAQNMDTDRAGNYLFYHVGPEKLKGGVVDPSMFGKNAYTSDKRRYPISMFYTRSTDGERMVSGEPHVVAIEPHKVYPFQKDPLGFYDQAEKNFRKDNGSDAAFTPNDQLDYIGELAYKAGFDMVVAKWGSASMNPLRGESQKPLKPNPEYTEAYRRFGSLDDGAVLPALEDEIRSAIADKASSASGVKSGLNEKFYSSEFRVADVLTDKQLAAAAGRKLVAEYAAAVEKSGGIYLSNGRARNSTVQKRRLGGKDLDLETAKEIMSTKVWTQRTQDEVMQAAEFWAQHNNYDPERIEKSAASMLAGKEISMDVHEYLMGIVHDIHSKNAKSAATIAERMLAAQVAGRIVNEMALRRMESGRANAIMHKVYQRSPQYWLHVTAAEMRAEHEASLEKPVGEKTAREHVGDLQAKINELLKDNASLSEALEKLREINEMLKERDLARAQQASDPTAAEPGEPITLEGVLSGDQATAERIAELEELVEMQQEQLQKYEDLIAGQKGDISALKAERRKLKEKLQRQADSLALLKGLLELTEAERDKLSKDLQRVLKEVERLVKDIMPKAKGKSKSTAAFKVVAAVQAGKITRTDLANAMADSLGLVPLTDTDLAYMEWLAGAIVHMTENGQKALARQYTVKLNTFLENRKASKPFARYLVDVLYIHALSGINTLFNATLGALFEGGAHTAVDVVRRFMTGNWNSLLFGVKNSALSSSAMKSAFAKALYDANHYDDMAGYMEARTSSSVGAYEQFIMHGMRNALGKIKNADSISDTARGTVEFLAAAMLQSLRIAFLIRAVDSFFTSMISDYLKAAQHFEESVAQMQGSTADKLVVRMVPMQLSSKAVQEIQNTLNSGMTADQASAQAETERVRLESIGVTPHKGFEAIRTRELMESGLDEGFIGEQNMKAREFILMGEPDGAAAVAHQWIKGITYGKTDLPVPLRVAVAGTFMFSRIMGNTWNRVHLNIPIVGMIPTVFGVNQYESGPGNYAIGGSWRIGIGKFKQDPDKAWHRIFSNMVSTAAVAAIAAEMFRMADDDDDELKEGQIMLAGRKYELNPDRTIDVTSNAFGTYVRNKDIDEGFTTFSFRLRQSPDQEWSKYYSFRLAPTFGAIPSLLGRLSDDAKGFAKNANPDNLQEVRHLDSLGDVKRYLLQPIALQGESSFNSIGRIMKTYTYAQADGAGEAEAILAALSSPVQLLLQPAAAKDIVDFSLRQQDVPRGQPKRSDTPDASLINQAARLYGMDRMLLDEKTDRFGIPYERPNKLAEWLSPEPYFDILESRKEKYPEVALEFKYEGMKKPVENYRPSELRDQQLGQTYYLRPAEKDMVNETRKMAFRAMVLAGHKQLDQLDKAQLEAAMSELARIASTAAREAGIAYRRGDQEAHVKMQAVLSRIIRKNQPANP